MKFKQHMTFYGFSFFIIALTLFSCQKEIKFTSSYAPIKQVINSNFVPDRKLSVNISRSKIPSDISSVDFLSDCLVDLFEDGVFKETMQFVLKDTLSGLGSYVSTFNLKQNKTYKIISTHPTLGIAEAEEFLPTKPAFTIQLLQHADTTTLTKTGKFSITFNDSLAQKNYYFIAIFYRYTLAIVDTITNDTTYKTENNFNIVPVSTEIYNPSNFNRVLFTDANFDGQTKSFYFDFPSRYDKKYKTIELWFEFSNVGFNYYEWTIQQLKPKENNLNEGEEEPYNLISNIKNGYGHFSAFSSIFYKIKLK
jgi:hypothetical protein